MRGYRIDSRRQTERETEKGEQHTTHTAHCWNRCIIHAIQYKQWPAPSIRRSIEGRLQQQRHRRLLHNQCSEQRQTAAAPKAMAAIHPSWSPGKPRDTSISPRTASSRSSLKTIPSILAALLLLPQKKSHSGSSAQISMQEWNMRTLRSE